MTFASIQQIWVISIGGFLLRPALSSRCSVPKRCFLQKGPAFGSGDSAWDPGIVRIVRRLARKQWASAFIPSPFPIGFGTRSRRGCSMVQPEHLPVGCWWPHPQKMEVGCWHRRFEYHFQEATMKMCEQQSSLSRVKEQCSGVTPS